MRRHTWVVGLFFTTVILYQGVLAKSASNVAQMSTVEIETAIQQCPLVQNLNRSKQSSKPPANIFSQFFSTFFPGGPALNALLATLYISGPPNFLLALWPPDIDPSSLSIMVAFAVGGLLGDTIFHLLPEIFLGESSPEHVRFVLVDPNKNLLLGVAMLVGFVVFVAMDKGLRIGTGGHRHDHGHAPNDEFPNKKSDFSPTATVSGIDSTPDKSSLKSRKSLSSEATDIPQTPPSLIELFLSQDEPDRTNHWLQSVVEEDPDSDITQLVLWRAYESQLKLDHEKPLLQAREFIKTITTLFSTAEAQTISVKTRRGLESKYIIKGIRPRGEAMTLEEYKSAKNAEIIKINLSSSASPTANHNLSTTSTETPSLPSPSVRLSAYLNLISDFTHNITDGLALSSSFYASPTLGATTTIAVFFHEIPHEVGDFALLVQSGFSKRKAMGAQFLTAIGAFLGTAIGIAVQELGGKSSSLGSDGRIGDDSGSGLAGTGLRWGDLLLPFTAGTFLYVSTVAVIPELLETGSNQRVELGKALKQLLAMTFGAGIMLA